MPASFASALVVLASACGDEDTSVSYADDVRPLFAQRCTLCHQRGAPYGPGTRSGPDVVNPYAEEDGLVVAPNNWYSSAHPELLPRVVVPGEPDNSFLIQKISDPDLLPDDAGAPMPLPILPITAQELSDIEQWVRDGAEDTSFFRDVVSVIFDDPRIGVPGKCDACHYEGTPNPPDLSNAFGPDGLVNVPSIFRRDLMRVQPGDPDASLLVQRVRASAEGKGPGSEFGAPMPLRFDPLSPAEVDTVRRWIAEGARP